METRLSDAAAATWTLGACHRYHQEELATLPLFVVLSSDDEFAMSDWTGIWFESYLNQSQSRLLIPPNSEHSLTTAIPELVPSLTRVVDSLTGGPEMPFLRLVSRDNDTMVVRLEGVDAAAEGDATVMLRHGETLTNQRRDFRWVRMATNESEGGEPCELPSIKSPKEIFGGGNCFVPIVWHEEELTAGADGTYTVSVPRPTHDDRWIGYYVEARFSTSHLRMTTPSYVYPETFPFPDCVGTSCVDKLV